MKHLITPPLVLGVCICVCVGGICTAQLSGRDRPAPSPDFIILWNQGSWALSDLAHGGWAETRHHHSLEGNSRSAFFARKQFYSN